MVAVRGPGIIHILWLILSFLCSATCEPPELSLPTTVVTLLETEVQQKTLVPGITCKDRDGDATRVYRRSITPHNPCRQCFPVWPCEDGQGYCLMFVPAMGTLNRKSVSSYVVQVTCTDDVDSTMSTQVIEVRLEANMAPFFVDPGGNFANTEVRLTSSKRTGELVYDVNAEDPDRDAVFYTMETDPDLDLFEIDYSSGKIFAKKDMRMNCQDFVVFRVKTFDSFNSPVGPVTIRTTLRNRNEAPEVQNTSSLVELKENKTASFKLDLKDINDDKLMYKLRAVPPRGLEYYSINKRGVISARKRLDYEYPDLRSVTLYVDVTDGFCDAETYSVTVQITDINEPPVIHPDTIERTVYEGFVSFDPGWTLSDPDEGDSHEWSTTRLSSTFGIDKAAGFVHSIGELDVDPKSERQYSFQVKVEDREGERDTGHVKLTVLDRNDNVPVFDKQLYTMSANPCTSVGVLIGKIHATDYDSKFQGNDQLVYSGSGVNLTVLATGDVALLNQCTEGQHESLEGFVTDQGTYPGPLSGVPTTIAFKCGHCPKPVTKRPKKSKTKPTTATTTTAQYDRSDPNDFLTSHLGWIAAAIFLFLLLVALLVYVICRYCTSACARWKHTRDLWNKSPKPKPRTVPSKSIASQREIALIEMRPLPTPPKLPPPEKEPFLFGFWKETFHDRDQKHMRPRNSIPLSVAKDTEIGEKESGEVEKEKEKKRLEREKVEDKYRQELKAYHQQLFGVENSEEITPVKNDKRCSVM